MNAIIDSILSGIVYLVASFVLFFLGKLAYGLVHRDINVKQELVEKDNLAFSIAHVGYFIGLLLAIGSVLVGPTVGTTGILGDLKELFFYGLLAIILLNISILINDKIVLRKFSVHDEIIRDQNAGTGVIEAASAIATGLIIFGSVSGEGGGWVTALVFWAVGQVLLVLTGIIYQAITPYDVHEHIEKDNVAAGIGFAGALIAIGNIVSFAVMPDFVSWAESLATIGIDFVIGIAFLPVARVIADKILLPGQKLTDEIINQEKPNVGAALIEAFAYIGGSVLITWCL